MKNLFLLGLMTFLVAACAVPQNNLETTKEPEQSKYRRALSSVSNNL